MKKINVIISLTTMLSVFAVSAASLDFREEYKHGEKNPAGRIKIGGSSGNHFFGVELKHAGNLSELKRSDEEFEYGYNYRITDQLVASPGFVTTFGSDNTTYKPQVRLSYSFENGITTKIRYRHEFRNYADKSTQTGRDGVAHDKLTRSKITGNIVYQWKAIQFNFETNYAEDFMNKEWKMGNNGIYEWDYNLTIGYVNSTKWKPYIELGNIQCTKADDCGHRRQLRSRVGISYKF